jgi:hypothetical protein
VEITGRVTKRVLHPILSSRLVTKLWVTSGRETRGSQREIASTSHWASHQKVAPDYVQSTSDKALDQSKKKKNRKRKNQRKSLGESPERWLPIMSSRLVEEKAEDAKERAKVTG